MTDGPSSAGPDAQLESKLRGLERLHIAGIITDDTYNELRSKLEAGAPPPAPSAAPASTPAAAPDRITYSLPMPQPVAGPSWAFAAVLAQEPQVSPAPAAPTPPVEPVGAPEGVEPAPAPPISRLTITVPPPARPAGESPVSQPSPPEPAPTAGDAAAAEAAAPPPAPAPRWSFGAPAGAEQPASGPAPGWSVRESPRRSASAWQATTRGTAPHAHAPAAPAAAEAVQPGSTPEATASPSSGHTRCTA